MQAASGSKHLGLHQAAMVIQSCSQTTADKTSASHMMAMAHHCVNGYLWTSMPASLQSQHIDKSGLVWLPGFQLAADGPAVMLQPTLVIIPLCDDDCVYHREVLFSPAS